MRVSQQRRHTNKDFKDNFVNLASNEPLKGHLVKQKRDAGDSQIVEGVLKQIIKKRIDTDGWLVEVGSGKDTFTYSCYNPQWSQSLPESTETDTMYVPKNKTRVQFSMDKKNKIYIIQRVIAASRTSIANYLDQLYISTDVNDKTNQDVSANMTMTKNDIKLQADNVVINSKGITLNILEIYDQQSQTIKEQNKTIQELQEQNETISAQVESLSLQIASFTDTEDSEEP